ncbi:hypothetical protein IWX46DRAFT_612843 [Phyllosticta citricarpa]|uniref:Secreted protein n=1 Tax=Phyllosticta citricarpa TaxID=55181 RepID=A0ABR1LEP6_9PEZI
MLLASKVCDDSIVLSLFHAFLTFLWPCCCRFPKERPDSGLAVKSVWLRRVTWGLTEHLDRGCRALRALKI